MADVTVENMVTEVNFDDEPLHVVGEVPGGGGSGATGMAGGAGSAAMQSTAEIDRLREILEPLVMEIIDTYYEQHCKIGH